MIDETLSQDGNQGMDRCLECKGTGFIPLGEDVRGTCWGCNGTGKWSDYAATVMGGGLDVSEIQTRRELYREIAARRGLAYGTSPKR